MNPPETSRIQSKPIQNARTAQTYTPHLQDYIKKEAQ